MKVLLITPEIAPYSRCSSLAEVAAALPKGLRGLGHQVTVVSPLYSGIDPNAHALARRLSTVEASLFGETLTCAVYDGRTTGGVDLVFVGHDRFGEAPEAGDSPETRLRGLLLGQAAAEIARTREPICEVVHGFGFQAALALPLAKRKLDRLGTVLSPHDVNEQGRFAPDELAPLSLPEDVLLALSASEGTPDNSLLAAGIRAADRVVTNSPSLAAALVAGEVAPELLPAIKASKHEIVGVPDGVDAAIRNPVVDPHLTARFDPADTGGKDECKGSLQYELGLPIRPDTPLLSAIVAGDTEILTRTLAQLLRNDVQVALAVEGEPQAALEPLLSEHDDQVKCIDVNDRGALHRLIGGADFLWTPGGEGHADFQNGSMHLAAQRYGTLPIGPRRGVTGETIVDCDAQLETGTGFVHDDDPAAILSALQRALAAYENTDGFEALRQRAMRVDTSWERAARRCEHFYRALL